MSREPIWNFRFWNRSKRNFISSHPVPPYTQEETKARGWGGGSSQGAQPGSLGSLLVTPLSAYSEEALQAQWGKCD